MIVLDASALLALLHREAGWQVVAREAAHNDATVSAVNYAEVLQKAVMHSVSAEQVDSALEALGITVSPFGRLDARLAASFYRHRSGLSLADRVAWHWPAACRASPSQPIAPGKAGPMTLA